MLVILFYVNLGNFEQLTLVYVLIYILYSMCQSPSVLHNRFLPHNKPTFWVSMGMNSQPPHPPLPGVSAPPIKPLDTTVSLLLYPLVTRGHQIPPPTLRGNSTRLCQTWQSHPSPPPPQPLPCAPTPQPRWPSLSANYLNSCCVHSSLNRSSCRGIYRIYDV